MQIIRKIGVEGVWWYVGSESDGYIAPSTPSSQLQSIVCLRLEFTRRLIENLVPIDSSVRPCGQVSIVVSSIGSSIVVFYCVIYNISFILTSIVFRTCCEVHYLPTVHFIHCTPFVSDLYTVTYVRDLCNVTYVRDIFNVTYVRDLSNVTYVRDLCNVTYVRDLCNVTYVRDLCNVTYVRDLCNVTYVRDLCNVTYVRDLCNVTYVRDLCNVTYVRDLCNVTYVRDLFNVTYVRDLCNVTYVRDLCNVTYVRDLCNVTYVRDLCNVTYVRDLCNVTYVRDLCNVTYVRDLCNVTYVRDLCNVTYVRDLCNVTYVRDLYNVTYVRDLCNVTYVRDLCNVTYVRDLCNVTYVRDLCNVTYVRDLCNVTYVRDLCNVTYVRDLTYLPDAAKLRGINIWGIGVGKGLDMSELDNLATNGAEQTFPIQDFNDLSSQLENLTRLACDKTACRRPMDMVFVIDGSNSLGEENFNLILKTVSNAVNSLLIGPNDTHVGAVVYSKSVTAFLDLQTDVNSFKTGVLRFDYPDETTATDLGIMKAVDILTSQRRNVPMTMIIITDGESDNRLKTKLEADAAKLKGINIWGVGVGKGLDMSELNNLATDGAKQTFYIEDFNDFSDQLENLTRLACVKTAVNSLVIGPNDTRVGAVVYSKTVTAYIELQTDVEAFKTGVIRFEYPDETTATDLGILRAVDILTSQRRNVPMTMIIITDGESDNRLKTKLEADAAKLRGINIWGVGVGKGLDMSELENLATNGAKQTFYIEDFKDFSDQLENLTRLACDKTEETICRRPMDMVFVIDGSNSLGEDNFNLILKTVSNAVNSLVIGPNDTRVGAVVYSKTVTAYIDLQTDVNAFKRGVLNFEYPDETTATDLGIIRAVNILTSQRRNVPMTMIIITDGESDNRLKTKLEADAAKLQGINIWGVGVGKGLDMSELNNLATNGAKQTFFIEDFNQFSDQLENLTRLACDKTEETVCSRPMDMVFVIDGSNSLGEDNFNVILKTVSTAVNSLVIGPNDTRVGAVLYSKIVSGYIDLQTDVNVFKTRVLNFEYPDETTATDLGILKAVDILMSQWRNVPMTMIIITDGESDNRLKTKLEADAAKLKGINIWGIGVGKGLDMSELDNLATNGAKQTFPIQDFNDLSRQLENLTRLACDKTDLLTTPLPTTTAAVVFIDDRDLSLCYNYLDLVLIIDGSNSIGEGIFLNALSTIARAVDSLMFGISYTRVAAVVYGDDVTAYIGLQTNASEFKSGILAFDYPDTQTRTDLGIKKAIEILNSSNRVNVSKAIMVITDGRSTLDLETFYQSLVAKSRGIDIWGVGVGNAADMGELTTLTTNGAQQVQY
ncbi:hypothetical protein Btru_029845 [Bulinus truncatus]|nr:hypothetical protein Btru_029845 [Bulinus truncatus]